MRPTFQQTVDVLVKAFFNNTLDRMECRRCAVGNIIEAAGGFDHQELGVHWPSFLNPLWRLEFNFEVGKFEVESTGYTAEELKRIERAFMDGSRPKDFFDEDDNFNGLMDVVDVLAKIHNIDLTAKEEAKALFVKV